METWPSNLAALLATLSLGTVGTSIFIGQLPGDFAPGTVAVLITPTAGSPSLPDGILHFPRCQILVRCNSFASAWTRAMAIYAALADRGATTLGTSQGCLIKPIQTPFSIGLDERQAWRVVCNYQISLSVT